MEVGHELRRRVRARGGRVPLDGNDEWLGRVENEVDGCGSGGRGRASSCLAQAAVQLKRRVAPVSMVESATERRVVRTDGRVEEGAKQPDGMVAGGFWTIKRADELVVEREQSAV